MTRRIVVRSVNAEGVSERHPEDEVRLGLTKPGRYGVPNVWAFCEVSFCDVVRIARSLDLYAIQEGERGSPEAGVALVSDRPLRPLGLIVGSRPTSDVRMRPMLGGRTYGLTWWALHAPPRYAGDVHDDYLTRARSRRGVLMGDFNEKRRRMQATSQRQYRALEHDVMGVLVPNRLRAGTPARVNVDSDHWGLDVPIWLPERRRRVPA